jgi:transposase-like protein
MSILPDIIELLQHLKNLSNDLNRYRPKYCSCGRTGLWCHGYYKRKSDRHSNSANSLNPIPIPRFFCPHCKKTTSVLPECIAPHRWYMWHIQQAVLLQSLFKKSFYKTSRTFSISRSTCRRWWNRLKERYLLHGSTLRVYYPELSCCEDVNSFWLACFEKVSLSKAMLICNQAGVTIP